MMPEKKSDAVRRLVAAKEYRKALGIAKDFRLGISRDERDTLRLAYECMVWPEFYRQVGRDVGYEIKAGVMVLLKLYGTGGEQAGDKGA